MRRFTGIPRRNVLLGGLAAPFLRPLGAQSRPPGPLVGADLHLHPRYRSETPLDAVIPKVKAGFDEFVTEKQHDAIAAILAQWSAGWLEAPRKMEAVERTLAADFSGTSLEPAESQIVRSGPALEIRRVVYAKDAIVDRSRFIDQLRK